MSWHETVPKMANMSVAVEETILDSPTSLVSLKSEMRSFSNQVPQILEGHASFVRSAAFSNDGRRVVSASDDHMLRL